MSDRTQSFTRQHDARSDDLKTIVATIDHQRDKYQGILPSDVPFDDFRNAFLIAVQMNGRLLEADRTSLWLALQKAASDGLKPDGREGALVIFGDDAEDEEGNRVASQARGKKKVVWMPMIAGLIKLVRNTGNVAGIRAKLIYQGETVVISDEDGRETYKHERRIGADQTIDDSTANIIGAFAVVNYKDGSWEMEAMSRRQIERVKATSRAKKGPWLPWYDEMAKKTVLRRLIKRLDRSRDLRKLDTALESDATMEIDGKAEDVAAEFTAEAVKQVAQEQQLPPMWKDRDAAHALTPQEMAARQRQQAENVAATAKNDEAAMQQARAQAVDQKIAHIEKTEAAEPTDDSPVEIWPVDATGEAFGDGPMTPRQFAEWFAATLATSENWTALTEHNADAIGDAGIDPEAARIITAAMAPKPDPKAAEPKSYEHKPIVALTPKGSVHDGNYRTEAKAQIAKLRDEADIEAWCSANRPTYRNKAIEIAIGNWLDDRRRILAAENPATVSTVPAQDYPVIDRVRTEIAQIGTKAGLVAWSRGPIRPVIDGLKVSDPAMYRETIAIIDELDMQLSQTETA